MATSEDVKAGKNAQVRDSIDRGGRAPDAAETRDMNLAAMDVVEDSNAPSDEVTPAPKQRQEASDEPAPKAKPISLNDKRRADIIAGFREHRAVEAEGSDEDAAEIRRLTRDGMPPELAAIEAGDTEVDDAGDAGETKDEKIEDVVDAPVVKKKIKVRGKEIEVTDDELLAYAQKGAAGDDYLNEARSKLDEVNSLLQDTKAKRAAPEGKHPADPNSPQTESDDATAGTEGTHPADPYADTVESVQLGTPEEAGQKLRATIEDAATTAAQAALERERLRDEAARSSRFLKEFQGENAELANDTLAHALMERKLYDLQVEDIKALGIDDSKLPKTPVDIANWHLWYRANGYKVRNIPELLTSAKDAVQKWKGVDPAKAAQPAARKAEPRVEVTVDRTQRRAAIPQQPARTSNPKPDSQAKPTQPRDRSDVVQQMMRSRALPRGRVIG